MRTAFRAYFFDSGLPAGRRELVDFPANGAPWLGCGGFAQDARGVFVQGTQTGVSVHSPRALAAGVGSAEGARVPGEVLVRLSDFPDRVGEIRVKVWHPDGGARWYTLAESAPPSDEALPNLGVVGLHEVPHTGSEAFAVAASDLGWGPGCWPREARLGGTPMVRDGFERDRENEVVAVVYRSVVGHPCTVRVFND